MPVGDNNYELQETDPVENVKSIKLQVTLSVGNSPVVFSGLNLICCYQGKERFENFESVS